MPIEFPKRLFRHKKVATAVGGTYDDVEFAPIEHGEQIFVEWVSAVNEDNAVTQVRLILVSGETEYNIEAQGTTMSFLHCYYKIVLNAPFTLPFNSFFQ